MNKTTIKYITDTPSRFSMKGHPARHWVAVYERMSQNDNTWNNLRVIDPADNKEADYYVIINHPLLNVARPEYNPVADYYDPKKTIVFHIEPPVVKQHGWGQFEFPEPANFMSVNTYSQGGSFAWWEINLHYNELKALKPIKRKCCSAILTGKNYWPGHKLRLNLVDRFLRDEDWMHLYGYTKPEWEGSGLLLSCKNYYGEFPFRAKEQGILPYKYHFCCENSMEHNYYTEKIVDAWLCEALPLYWGCPNLDEIYPKESYIWLPLDAPDGIEEAHEIMSKAIHDNEWEKRRPAIREAKRLAMDKYNLFPTIERIIG